MSSTNQSMSKGTCPKRALISGMGLYFALPPYAVSRQMTASPLQLFEWEMMRKKKEADAATDNASGSFTEAMSFIQADLLREHIAKDQNELKKDFNKIQEIFTTMTDIADVTNVPAVTPEVKKAKTYALATMADYGSKLDDLSRALNAIFDAAQIQVPADDNAFTSPLAPSIAEVNKRFMLTGATTNKEVRQALTDRTALKELLTDLRKHKDEAETRLTHDSEDSDDSEAATDSEGAEKRENDMKALVALEEPLAEALRTAGMDADKVLPVAAKVTAIVKPTLDAYDSGVAGAKQEVTDAVTALKAQLGPDDNNAYDNTKIGTIQSLQNVGILGADIAAPTNNMIHKGLEDLGKEILSKMEAVIAGTEGSSDGQPTLMAVMSEKVAAAIPDTAKKIVKVEKPSPEEKGESKVAASTAIASDNKGIPVVKATVVKA